MPTRPFEEVLNEMNEETLLARERVLKTYSTKELVDELTRREGVKEHICPDPDHMYSIRLFNAPPDRGQPEFLLGPARILVVID